MNKEFKPLYNEIKNRYEKICETLENMFVIYNNRYLKDRKAFALALEIDGRPGIKMLFLLRDGGISSIKDGFKKMFSSTAEELLELSSLDESLFLIG